MNLLLLLQDAVNPATGGGSPAGGAGARSDLSIMLGYMLEYAIPALKAIAILIGAWLLGGWVRRGMLTGFERAKFDPTLTRFFSNSARWAALILGILAAVSVLGVQLTVFAAVIGAAGLAIGLALQGSLANFAGGIMLLIFRPFKVGDFVNVAGQLGKVNDLDLFTTAIDTPDGRRIILPNGQVFGNIIENITHNPQRRIEIPISAAYGADIDATRAALEGAIKRIPGVVADPKADVVLVGLGASSVDWMVRVWARREDFFIVKQATVRAAKMALDEAGIEIPFPQTTVTFGGAVKVEGEGREQR